MLPEELGEDTWLRKLEEEMLDLIARQSPHTGLRHALNEVRRLASVVRDRLSIDTWRILNQLHQDMRLRHGRIQFDDVLVAPEPHDHGSGGVQRHGNGEHDARPRLALPGPRPPARTIGEPRSACCEERCEAGAPADGAIVEPLLEIADSSMTYRRRYFARPRLAPALHLLLADDTNTRGLAFQLAAVSEHIRRLPRDPTGAVADARGTADRTRRDTLSQAEAIVSDAWSDDGARDARRAARLDRRRPAGAVGRDHLLLLQPRGAACELIEPI